MDQNPEYLVKIEQELDYAGKQQLPRPTIFKVPESLARATDKLYAFNPHIISIGPLHAFPSDKNQIQNLHAMNECKKRYAANLLKRASGAGNVLIDCHNTLLKYDADVRKQYADAICHIDLLTLARMMLIDGCFLIELFIRFKAEETSDARDPIFNSASMLFALRRDLLLLENQIPFFILQSLFDKTVAGLFNWTLMQYVLNFFRPIHNLGDQAIRMKTEIRADHLVDAVLKCFQPLTPRDDPTGGDDHWDLLPSATDLFESGIEFQVVPEDNLFHIRLDGTVLHMPQLQINGSTDSLFRNLVAFEQCNYVRSHFMTSYVVLLDRLIDTAEDVRLLHRKRIIANHIGEDESVARMVNHLTKGAVLDPKDFYFRRLCQDLHCHYNRTWPRYRVALARDYFKNPWTIVSVAAAVLLLSLTIIQTYFTVFPR